MTNFFFLALISTGAAFAATSLAQEPPPAKHPLVGTWQWTHKESNCSEVYVFRADGTASIESRDERTDNTFTVAKEPDANGFYRVVLLTTKDHGGKDCVNDSANNTGLESVNHHLFTPDRNQMLTCYEPTRNACFGPLRRVK
jgi:hypothetical protein